MNLCDGNVKIICNENAVIATCEVDGPIYVNGKLVMDTITVKGIARLKAGDHFNYNNAIRIASMKMERQYHKFMKYNLKLYIRKVKNELYDMENAYNRHSNMVDIITEKIISLTRK